ncbi:MAG: hypothetical protein FJ009_18750 [Chloroflexi bacterium]|nr:hypothetical protein [Chloroflexota bacterium]
MSSKPEHKPGRNEPCWCSSGKKYKNCHLRQDEDVARASMSVASTPPTKSVAPFTPPEPPKPQPPTPEELADHAKWDKFEAADPEGKIAFFLERLESKRLDADDAFEAYLQIRDTFNPRHDAAARTRLIELIERLRRDAPKVYQDSAVYLEDLIVFAVTDERWDTLPNLLAEFADIAHKKPDEFSSVMKMMLYHGQTRPLVAAMKSAWHKVSTSKDILEWGVNEYYGTLVELALYQYLETTTTPRADDPGLLEAIGAFGGKPNQEWLATAVEHLSAPAAAPWRVEDFGAMVDAETWEHNVAALLFDWMADQHRRAAKRVPFSKSDLFKEEMQEILHQQISEGAPQQTPKGKHGKSKRAAAQEVASPLIPRYALLDRALVDKFQLLGSQPYEAGTLVELLPTYLHFIARLGLIHPTEMDEAFASFKPLIGHALKLLDSYGADIHLLRTVEAAWSDATLGSLRDDPDLVSVRTMPVIVPSIAPTTARDAQTYRFKVSYRHADDIWFIIEASAKHTLDDLHSAIIDAADFDDDHLHAFFLSGRAWDKETEYGHGDACYSSAIPIGNLHLRMKQRFLYLFDFGDQHEFDVQLIETSPEPPHEHYPRIVEQHGKMPPQYPNWDDESEEEDELDSPNQMEAKMKQAQTNFRVGDCVRVKDGVQDPDFGADIGGWQGRISNIDTSGDDSTVSIQWDSITLKQMPVEMIEQCEEQGLDWAEMALGANEVEPVKPRDTERDVTRIKEQLSNKHGWVSLGEEGKRIQKILAVMDADEDIDEFGAWEEHLEKNLRFPFEAVIAESQERGPLRGGDKVIVTGNANATDEMYGIIVDLKMGRRKYAFPLCDLEATDKESANYQLVKDYAVWFANR